MKKHVVFVHGWGVNAGVWRPFVERLGALLPNVMCHTIDLPGYGDSVAAHSSDDLTELAQFCLNQAPDSAVWVGWSLGGMVTVKAALLSQSENKHKRILGMQLIATTACFVAQPHSGGVGVDGAVFQRFSDQLASNYRTALSMFLLLQSGISREARALAKAAHDSVCGWPSPSSSTLQAGMDCLLQTDMRPIIADNVYLKQIPTQVIACELDRVANPQGSEQLSTLLSAELISIRSGHAPFLTNPDSVMRDLLRLLECAYD